MRLFLFIAFLCVIVMLICATWPTSIFAAALVLAWLAGDSALLHNRVALRPVDRPQDGLGAAPSNPDAAVARTC
jgi:hypothetical protein